MADVTIRQPVPLRTVPGIELAAIGTWKASTGQTTFTPEDLAGAVAALDCPGVRNPVIKLGHDEEDSTGGVRWDGEPAVGWIGNMRFDADGKLRGDLTGMPAWLADADDNGLSVLAAAYPDRSIEIWRPFICQVGHTHPSVITAVALLGVAPPGVGVLKSMQDVYAAWTQQAPERAAASGQPWCDCGLSLTVPPGSHLHKPHCSRAAFLTTVTASIGDTMPAAVKASVSVEDISRRYYESAGYSTWITAMHVDPLELVVSDDADGKFYRVPVELKGSKFEFGEPQEVAIVYKDVKSAAAALPYRWDNRAAALSAQGVDESQAVTAKPGPPPAVEFTAPATGSAEPKVERELPPAEAIKRVASATTKTPDADVAAGQPDKAEEATNVPFDAAKYREAFGLPDSLSDDEVRAQALAALTPTTPTTSEAKPAETTGPDPAALLAALPENAGVIVLDKDNYQTLIEKADQGVQALAMARAGERDSVLRQAMHDGRFPPAKLSHYAAMWDKNPDATREFVGMLPKNSIPTQLTSGLLSSEFDKSEADTAYEAVYGKGH